MEQLPYNRWRPHPWHGLEIGKAPPRLVQAYIEITPFDLVKYEVDKNTGYLRVDRPQRTSSSPPTLYGFIPRTYCGHRVGLLAHEHMDGDGDPMDICVVSERPIEKSEVILNTVVVGGIRMIDRNQADDKIIAVLENDNFWGKIQDVSELPPALVERLHHYFLTYKLRADKAPPVRIEETYGSQEAQAVVQAAMDDYQDAFGHLQHGQAEANE